MKSNEIKEIETIIQYEFNNKALLNQAFVFSVEQEDDPRNNDVLRTIGKRVIRFSIINILVNYYSVTPKNMPFRVTVGTTRFNDLYNNIDSKDIFSIAINVLGLAQYIENVDGNAINDPNRKLFEAIMGAVSIDCNNNFEIINKVLSYIIDFDYWIDHGFNNLDSNPVILVYNYSVEAKGMLPTYTYTNVKDEFGNEFVKCVLNVPGIDQEFEAQGDNSNLARLSAAETAYKFLTENKLVSSIVIDAGEFSEENAMDTLDNLALKGYFMLADYHTVQKDGAFEATCVIEDIDRQFTVSDPDKKTARNKAAYKMLLYVLGYEVE